MLPREWRPCGSRLVGKIQDPSPHQNMKTRRSPFSFLVTFGSMPHQSNHPDSSYISWRIRFSCDWLSFFYSRALVSWIRRLFFLATSSAVNQNVVAKSSSDILTTTSSSLAWSCWIYQQPIDTTSFPLQLEATVIIQTWEDCVARGHIKTNPKRRTKKTILVGGKGFIGKTPVSSAIVVHLTSERPDLNILMVSTDPAHFP
jgi:hypothetical protein